ncbi:hypothetical protein HMPREF9441_00466 [Paraprevotella clara YIT 11840]|uniref:Uncharacterized protein n=1 Tax=Paraprevotella clara YIT 11840 TaxID=762968 RepID=G5SM92_9BACT|nr:hypothetical protein HMPREF9441_00466 [Paraprevotella clara YIT 11840]
MVYLSRGGSWWPNLSRMAVWPSVFSWQTPILSKGDFLYLNLTR